MGHGRFLICLPTQLCALVFSLGEFLFTGILAVILWLALVRNEEWKEIQLNKPLLAGVIALTAIYTLAALFSFAGFVSTIYKSTVGIRTFAATSTLLLALQAVFSLLYVIAIYVEPKNDFIQQCEAWRRFDSSVVDQCTNRMQEFKGVIVLIVAVSLLLHAYEAYAYVTYVSELEYSAGENSNGLSCYDESHVCTSLTNALLATAFFRCWHILLFYGAWATVVALINYNICDFTMQPTLLTLTGLVLGFVISYRTTSSFERYNDGRRYWSQITLANRTFAHTIWFHIPAMNPEGSEDMNENKARVLIEKKTAINLLEAFAVAIKHYLRGEFGIYYADLYHLVKFLPPYARSLAKTSACDVSGMAFPLVPNRNSNVQATSPLQGSFISHKPEMPRRKASSSSSVTMVPAPKASSFGKAFSLYRKSKQTQTFNTEEPQYSSRMNEDDFLLPARMPPRYSFVDLFPFSAVVRFFMAERNQAKRMRYAKENPGGQDIPLEISLYLSSYVAELQHRKVATVPTANSLLAAINQLGDALTGLDRIVTTPIPFSYMSHLWVVATLYCLLLPLQIWPTLHWFTIPATVMVVFTFFGFLVAGSELENPFGYGRNDFNLDHFTDVIRHDLRLVTVPHPNPSMWAFSPENDMIFASDPRSEECVTPDDWVVKRGLSQVYRALERLWEPDMDS